MILDLLASVIVLIIFSSILLMMKGNDYVSGMAGFDWWRVAMYGVTVFVVWRIFA
jgi:hypothetical protein